MMVFIVFLTICTLSCGALALLAEPLVKGTKPCIAVPLLACGSVVSSLCLGLVLSLLGLAVLGRLPFVASAFGWSADLLETAVPVPVAVGSVAGLAAVVLLIRASWRTCRIVFLLGCSDRLGRRMRGVGGPIAIVDTTDADAYTLAGIKGCVVISRQLLTALGPLERRLLIAHELSHLRRRHHLYVHAVDIAVAANPTLKRMSSVVRLGVERWADEDAAAILGNRTMAAAALAKTALIRSTLRRSLPPPATPLPVLCIAASHIGERAAALMSPAPRRSVLMIGLTAILIVTGAGSIDATIMIHAGFEKSETHCHHQTALTGAVRTYSSRQSA